MGSVSDFEVGDGSLAPSCASPGTTPDPASFGFETGSAALPPSCPDPGGDPANQSPVVSAGPNQTITYGSSKKTTPITVRGRQRFIVAPIGIGTSVVLSGSVTDDGLPTGGVLSFYWFQVSGPALGTFSDIHSLTPTFTFPGPGVYVLELLASDGALQGSAQTTITVNAPAPAGCTCSVDELWTVWKARKLHPAAVVKVAQVLTPIPVGFKRHRACLQFLRVVNGAVVETFGQTIASNATSHLLGITVPTSDSICYGILFSGFQRRHYANKTVPPDFHGRQSDFTIYKILCET